MRVEATHNIVGRMPLFPQAVVRVEPSFERRTLAWVREHGGPVANAFVGALPPEYQNADTFCDCHLSYMKEGWRYRAKGQWHSHGADPRGTGLSKYDPALRPPIVAIIGSVSLTRVCEGSFELPDHDRGRWDRMLRELIATGAVREREIEEGALVLYGFGDFHASVQAQATGWRLILSAWNGAGAAPQLAPMHCVENVYSPQWPVSPEAARTFDPYRVTWPPHHPVHPSHDSHFTLENRVAELPSAPLELESPLFACDLEFAHQNGGPITRAVLDALPQEWRAPGSGVIVDSFLNWLYPGRVPGWDLFHFEPFPAQYEGARALANWNEEQEHISCVLSQDAPTEFVVGRVTFEGDPAAQDEYWRFCTNLRRRHDALCQQIEQEVLRVERIPPFTLYSHGWGDFFRATPASQTGFHFRVRASRGARRPICNALRNFDCADLIRF